MFLPQNQRVSFFNTEKHTQSHSNVQDLKSVDLRDLRNLFENIKRINIELLRAQLSLNSGKRLVLGVDTVQSGQILSGKIHKKIDI